MQLEDPKANVLSFCHGNFPSETLEFRSLKFSRGVNLLIGWGFGDRVGSLVVFDAGSGGLGSGGGGSVDKGGAVPIRFLGVITEEKGNSPPLYANMGMDRGVIGSGLT